MHSKKETTDGEIVNLMSVDAQRLQDLCDYSYILWNVLVDVVLTALVMWKVIGPSVLAGVILLCVLILVNGFYATTLVTALQIKQMVYKDKRLRLISEILNGIKVIKLYAWEKPFLEKIMSARTKELYYLRLATVLGAVSSTIWFLTPCLASVAIFATYVLISPLNVLDPYKAFVTLSLINIISQSTCILPITLNVCGQAIVSLKRISKFLNAEELDNDAVEKDFGMHGAISISNGNFSWERSGQLMLTNINLKVAKGRLVAVIGPVGCGKSSLLSAMLGEMTKQDGSVIINGSTAYVPQQPWILNSSLRDNVTFGKDYKDAHYSTIIEATALLPDLDILPDGDMTEIGDKGINLSGGQKQRVSLARAVYQDADIYLMDDPLSAVDAHVGKHIFDKVISNKGLLKDKTRILVTHGAGFLQYVDIVIVINDNIISKIGSYHELVEQGGNISEFLQKYNNGASEQISEDVSWSEKSAENQGYSVNKKEGPQKIRQPKPADSKPATLIEDESAANGHLRIAIIWRYIQSAGTKVFYIVLLFFVLLAVTQVSTNIWLRTWSADEAGYNGTLDTHRLKLQLSVYGALGAGQAICTAVLLVASALGCVSASSNLHTDLLKRLLRAPMAFYDCIPLGRILNRCSMDMDLIDSNMPYKLSRFFFALGPTLSTLFVISVTTPMFLVPCIPIVILWGIIQHIYVSYIRQLRRIASIRCSPIYSHYDKTLHGATSIRAFGLQKQFTDKCDQLIEDGQQAIYLILVAQRCLGVLMEVVGSLIVFFAALFAVLSRDSLAKGMAALSVSYALNITSLINLLIRVMTDLEINMVSVERVDEYCHIDQEADWEIPDTETKEDWPEEGRIEIKNYGTRYRPGLDLVLRNINCDIPPGQKVGIVGRTGAGKTSLALSLVRVIEAVKGSISIDRIPIASLGLHNLRSRLTVIPQDPAIFSGSLRANLDPFSKYSDGQLWSALEKAHLKDYVELLPEGLDYDCRERGQILSAGQRQLVCLARAILRKTKVLILDEATAAVDLETDALIQKAIRDIFADCTVLAIAHRLSTVMDYDKVIVMEEGQLVEFDSPVNLLGNTHSLFYSLAKEAGVI